MRFKVIIVCLFLVSSLLSAISLAQSKVVVIPLGTDATGDATETDVVQGKTFSNQNDNGIAGIRPPAPVPKINYQSSLHPGVSWPSPRFTGNVLLGFIDNLTGLHWAMPEPEATFVGLSNASSTCYNKEITVLSVVYDDWRLPNVLELHSLILYAAYEPALPPGHPFGGVQNAEYWTKTAIFSIGSNSNWTVDMADGSIQPSLHTAAHYVWCVRSGFSD